MIQTSKRITYFLFSILLITLFTAHQVEQVAATPQDNVFQVPPFSQDWSNPALITTNDDWSGVAGIIGYRGDNLTAANDVNPQTVLADDAGLVVDVNANQTNTNSSTGGVSEFDITDDVVAFQGSGTADAPYLLLHINTTGFGTIQVSYNVRDIDGSSDNSVQQLALHYRVGSIGSYTDVPAAYIADGSTGPSLATLVTPISVTLPVDVDNQAMVYLRIMTTNATGNDEWLGIDDISITGTPLTTDLAPFVTAVSPIDGATNIPTNGNLTVTFQEDVTLDPSWYDISCAISGNHTAAVSGGPALWALNPDSDFAANELCTVTLDKDLVHDLDSDDPPDTMDADYIWSFTTSTVSFGSCGDGSESLIHDVQGSGATSPLAGATVVVEAVVVGDYQDTTTELGGFYLQEEDGDADGLATSSEGLFIYDYGFGAVVSGDWVRVQGTVTEFIPTGFTQSLTELNNVTSLVVCGATSTPTPATISLPVPALTDWEQYEGMLANLPQTLAVTEVFNLGRYGEVLLAEGGRVYQYTHFNAPNVAGYATYQATVDLQTILLDDANSQQNRDPITHPAPGLTFTNTLRIGDSLTNLTAVLDHRFDTYRLQPIGSISFSHDNLRETTPTHPGGSVTVASMNVLNYFVTIDSGLPICGPAANQDCRGADSPSEFTRQRSKTINALIGLNADVVGLMEMENHPTDDALQDLVDGVNAVLGAGTYSYVNTGILGSDAIKVAILYKPAVVSPTLAYMADNDPIHNRPPLAQTFEEISSGEQFTLVVNHFKSKNCADAVGLDLDLGDGQSCYNNTRVQQATQLLNFINGTVIPTSGDADVLIMGDLNSYAMEDPITTLIGDGYTDLVNSFIGSSGYSYVFDGQSGYLDHGLATASLLGQVAGISEWHINGDEPRSLDYNEEFKSLGQLVSLYGAAAFRSSDHDPLVVGLNLMPTDFSSLMGYADAWHYGNSLYLGTGWNDGSDNGVDRLNMPWIPSLTTTLAITSSDMGYVAVWADWNDDGLFDDFSEQVLGQNVANAGTHNLTITVHPTFDPVAHPILHVRVRFYPEEPGNNLLGIETPDGGAVGGEVEDFSWEFTPTAVGLESAGTQPLPTLTLWLALFFILCLLSGRIWRMAQK